MTRIKVRTSLHDRLNSHRVEEVSRIKNELELKIKAMDESIEELSDAPYTLSRKLKPTRVDEEKVKVQTDFTKALRKEQLAR